jgi:hypothetical protein
VLGHRGGFHHENGGERILQQVQQRGREVDLGLDLEHAAAAGVRVGAQLEREAVGFADQPLHQRLVRQNVRKDTFKGGSRDLHRGRTVRLDHVDDLVILASVILLCKWIASILST